MKKIILSVLFFSAAFTGFAQTARKVVVEHFTNTLCSICASRNPAFYNTMENYPQVIHIAYHPSSPYVNCTYSKQNKTENDSRTNFYGIYGATPRVVLQGNVVPTSATLIKGSDIDTALNKFAPYSLQIDAVYITPDSVDVTTTLIVTAVNSYTALNYYLLATEDTIYYNAPNGETLHHDVFRKQLNGIDGTAISPQPFVGNSMVLKYGIKLDGSWDKNRISFTGIMQTPEKFIVQAERQSNIEGSLGMGVMNNEMPEVKIYPNPATGYVIISSAAKIERVEVYDITGRMLEAYNGNITTLAVQQYNNGVYFIKVKTTMGSTVVKQMINN